MRRWMLPLIVLLLGLGGVAYWLTSGGLASGVGANGPTSIGGLGSHEAADALPRGRSVGEPLPLVIESRTAPDREMAPPRSSATASDGGAGQTGSLLAHVEGDPESGPATLLAVPMSAGDDGTAPGSLATEGTARFWMGPYSAPRVASAVGMPPDVVEPGRRVWKRLAPGAWRVVSAPGSAAVPARVMPLQLRPGTDHEIWVQLLPAWAVSVRLELPNGQPVAGARVRVMGPLSEGIDPSRAFVQDLVGIMETVTRTDEEGVARVTGVHPGSYSVHAWTDDGTRATATVTAQPASADPWRLEAVPSVRMKVFVADRESGAPLEGAELAVVDNVLSGLSGEPTNGAAGLREAAHASDRNGLIEVDCEPGAWLLCNCPAFGIGTVQVTREAASIGEITVLLDAAGRDVFTVVRPDGSPVQGAQVDACWTDFTDRGPQEVPLGSARSDNHGVVTLDALGRAPDSENGSYRFVASHPSAGRGTLELPIEFVREQMTSLPKTIVLRAPGALELHLASVGWPDRTPDEQHEIPRESPRDVQIKLELNYLGTPAMRTEFSTHQGLEKGVVLTGDPGDTPVVHFEDLEPGLYAVRVSSFSPGFRFTTPTLRVLPGETTIQWIDPPDPAASATVTLALEGMLLLPARGSSSTPDAILESVRRIPGHGITHGVLPPGAGGGDVERVSLGSDGRFQFRLVLPGRYIINVPVHDPAGGDAFQWRVTRAFDVGPGDDVLLRALEPFER